MSKQDKQRQMWVRIIAIILAGLMLLGIVLTSTAGYAQEAEAEACDRYELQMDVLLDEQVVRVTQNVYYTNSTGGTLNGMMFSVYANILRRQSASPIESDRIDDAFPEGYAPGGVDFMSIRVNGEKAQWGIRGAQELFLRVECELQPQERALFTFEYYLLLPSSSLALGAGDLTWRLVNFYPIAAVWDEYAQEFVLNGYTAMGEPVYSENADYHVTLSLPETYALAAPGEVSAVNENGIVRYEIEARNVRSLAILFSRKMILRTAQTDSGTELCVWANTARTADIMVREALDMMNYLEKSLGEYPWQRLSLMETEYVYEGISSPGVIQISRELTGLQEKDELTHAIRRMCARQYFSCIVGSDPNDSPWLSDLLSDYMTLMYTFDAQGEDAYLRAFNAQILPALQITIPGGMTVDSNAERFNSRMEYDLIVVDRGAVVLHDMRQSMRHEVFMSALREYVRRMSMKNADAEDFLSAMNDVSGRRWDEYLYGQMHNMDDYVSESIEWYE